MKILKLPWFGHRTDNKKIECYSVTINSDGTRLASGGLDGNVKIWDTKTILEFNKLADVKDKAAEPDCVLPDPSLRRPLCSMSRHNGVVTTVKFSPDGRFLASGSDDKICLIWEKDDELVNRPKQFGESEADLEHWNIRKRLVAHDNDIQDIAWSPDGLLLVTVGLDRLIIIWNALSFERIKRYDVHQSMVKGIVFDPANKFFATASDDRTVRIFRYYKKLNDYNNYEFQVEHIVIDPFKKSPLTSYFRRMSWSPDGQHIAVPNATNGPVSSVVIINRGNWTTDISLIGHEAPCEVCAFSPRMFDTATSSKDSLGGLSTVLATAGQDRTLAIWRTTSSRPLVLAQDIVDNSITDMCWSPDGQSLFLCCLDGSITVVSFELGELGKMVSEDMINDQLNKYGADRDSNIFPESVGQLILESKSKVETDLKSKEDLKFDQKPLEVALIKSKNEPADILQSRLQSKLQNQPHNNLDEQSDKLSSPNIANLTPQQMTKMVQSVTMKNGKKRVAPLLISSSSSSPFKAPAITTNKVFKNTKISLSNYYLPRLGLTTSVNGLKLRSLHKLNELEPDHDNDNDDMGGNNNPTTQATSQTLSEASLKRQRNKHRRSVLEMRYPSSFKLISDLPETLFYSPAVVNAEANQLLNTISNNTASGTGNASTGIAVNGTVSVSASTSTASSIAPKETTEISNFSNIDTDEDLYFSVIIHGILHTYDLRNKLVNEADDHANRKRQVRTTIEVRNGLRWPTNEDEMVLDDDPLDRLDFNDPTRVIVSTSLESSSRSYSLHFPFKIQHAVGILLKGMLVYYALVSFHGTVQIVYAFSGNYLCPGMELGENVVAIRQLNGFLTMLTNSGQLHSWRLFDGEGKKIVAILKGVSIAPIVNMVEIDTSSQGKKGARSLAYALPNVKSFEVGLDGSPYAVLENTNDIYRYSIDMRCWTKLVDSWYYLSVAPLGSTPTIKLGKVLEQLVYKTYKDFKDDVKRAKINTYNLEDLSLTYLRRNMALRFEETIEAQGGLQD